jgi:hypothetical protein
MSLVSNEGYSVDATIKVTAEDIRSARQAGATGGLALIEAALNSALDRMGVPREGRTITMTSEAITVRLPPAWRPHDDEYDEEYEDG